MNENSQGNKDIFKAQVNSFWQETHVNVHKTCTVFLDTAQYTVKFISHG